MPVSINNTTLTFNDATTQTTAGVTSVGAGTGISSSGGLTPTIANTGVTSLTAGTGISLSGSTGGVTVTSTATGTVTSVATGNGLSGGTITSTGTLVVACPGFNTVGSYVTGRSTTTGNVTVPASGSTFSAGSGSNQVLSGLIIEFDGISTFSNNNLSGSWRSMGAGGVLPIGNSGNYFMLFCRIS